MLQLHEEMEMRTVRFANGRGQSLLGVLAMPRAETTKRLVIMPPGYERRIHHYSVFARYLVRHGHPVLRFDLSNHIGFSDGDVHDFTMSSMAEDIRAAVDYAIQDLEAAPAALIAFSLAARATVRAAMDLADAQERLAQLVLLLPVIDTEATTTAAIGHNVIDEWRSGAVTDPSRECEVLNHLVTYEFSRDALDNGWAGAEGMKAELAGLPVPVTAIAAERDDWVSPADVTSAFAVEAPAFRQAVFLEATSHDLAHNAPVVRLLMERVLETLDGSSAPRVEHLEFDEVVETVKHERALKRDAYASLESDEVMT